MTSTERTRATRARREAEGLPDPQKVQRAIAKAAPLLSDDQRQALLSLVIASVPVEERDGMERAARAFLALPE
jgi:hypothetical protein